MAKHTRVSLVSRVQLLKICCIIGMMFVAYLNIPHRRTGSWTSLLSASTPTHVRASCVRALDTGRSSTQYTIVVDAGSTGSRVHVYRFNTCGATPLLEKEFFKMTEKRPQGAGLSSYETAEAAAESLDVLVDFAQASIPAGYHECTPITVKATAGLRMLGEDESSRILQAVRARLKTYPFLLPPNAAGGVEIMTGADEAVFAWTTTNYLTRRLERTDIDSSTASIFDLGGGSLQLAFQIAPSCERDKVGLSTLDSHARCVDSESREILLYQHSHLGLGLISARERLYQMLFDQSNPKTTLRPHTIQNPCLAPGTNLEAVLHGTSAHGMQQSKMAMKGPAHVDKSQCHALLQQLIGINESCAEPPCSLNGVHQPPIATVVSQDSKIYIFSYFYDRISTLGMSNPFTVGELDELADTVCSGDQYRWHVAFGHVHGALNALIDMPEWCFDLRYMSILLREGFRLSLDREVITADKIGGMEVGWCLGAGLELLNPHTGRLCIQSQTS